VGRPFGRLFLFANTLDAALLCDVPRRYAHAVVYEAIRFPLLEDISRIVESLGQSVTAASI
jgi:hypothetical protein